MTLITITSPTNAVGSILNTGSLTANAINATTNDLVTGNVVGTESFYFIQFLEEGSYGSEVMELQKFLNGAGYDAGKLDGKFGLKTKEALIQFQTANNLKSDGIVGYETRTFLNK